MKRRAEWTLAVIVLLAIAGTAEAGIERAGTTSANFLSVGAGAGILGMGGATLGWGGDLNAVSWNPAALGYVGGTQVVISHAGVGDQSSQEWAAVGGKFVPLSTHWALTGLYHGDGSFDGLDASGASTGSFGVSSMALGATFARNFLGVATVGLGAKFVTEKLGDVTGTGGTFDAGLMVHTGPFGIGAAAQNVGGRMNYNGSVYPMPSNYGVGASFEHRASGVRVALDLNFPTAYYSDVRTGVEWRWHDRVALRTGYRREMGGASDDPLTGPTFGLGTGARGMWFDYGYLLGGNGGGQHRLGISFHPGGLLSGGEESDHYGSTVRPVEPTGPPAPARTMKSAPKSAATVTEPRPTETLATPKSEPQRSAGTPVATAPQTTAPRSAAVAPETRVTTPTAPAGSPLPQVAIAKPKAAPAALPVEMESRSSRPTLVNPPAVAKPTIAEASAVKAAPPVAVVAPATTVTSTVATPAVKSATPAAATALPVVKSAPPASVTSPVSAVVAPPPTATSTVRAATPAAPPTASALPRPAKVKVEKGETLYQIAQRWGTSVPAIMMENNLVSDKVRSGQTLKLPQR